MIRKAFATTFGFLGLMVGAVVIAGAITILVQDRDADDFFKSDPHTFAQPGHAIVSEDIEIMAETPSWVIDVLGDPVDFRVEGTLTGGGELFLGVGPAADVDAYLSGVTVHEVTGIDLDGSTIGGVDYRTDAGIAVPAEPTAQTFWAESAVGSTLQTLDWDLEAGNWKLVVMNADAAEGVSADLALGVKVANIVAIAWIAIGFGALSLLGGAYLIYRGLRRADEAPPQFNGGVIDLRDEVAEEERTIAEKV